MVKSDPRLPKLSKKIKVTYRLPSEIRVQLLLRLHLLL